jgi:ABC-2 type transport system permease protein
MHVALAIAKKEVRVCFSSAWGWLMLTGAAFVASFAFSAALTEFLTVQATVQKMGGWASAPSDLLPFRNLTEGVMIPFCGMLSFCSLFFCALLSARTVAEEKSQGTFVLLRTSPIRTVDIVTGKFLGSLAIFAVAWLLGWLYPILLSFYGASESGHALDLATVATGYLGVLLVGMLSLSLGLFVSTLTNSVVLATCISGAASLVWILARSAVPSEEPWRSAISALMFDTQLSSLFQGLIDARPFAFFLGTTALFLVLSHRSLEIQRQR